MFNIIYFIISVLQKGEAHLQTLQGPVCWRLWSRGGASRQGTVSEWGSADRATVGERIGDQPTHLKKSGFGFFFGFFWSHHMACRILVP